MLLLYVQNVTITYSRYINLVAKIYISYSTRRLKIKYVITYSKCNLFYMECYNSHQPFVIMCYIYTTHKNVMECTIKWN
jgi:hypothetical protein